MGFVLWFACLICMISGAHADSGDDFSNNLFSDIGPLLSLLGEQFTKQFMSESMGWMDHILLAMGPLGILTIITAAIRVSGPAWLRAMIGRARENRASVELELMSSTSHEVCELWNGQGLVRTMGRPDVQEIIFFDEEYTNPETFGLHTLKSAVAEGLLTERALKDPLTLLWRRHHNEGLPIDEEKPSDVIKRDQPPTLTSAPNISLNLHDSRAVYDLLGAALCGILLQLGFLLFTGFSVYNPHFSSRLPKNEKPVRPYAYPIMAGGTALLTVGILICSAVVDYSTEETEFIPVPRKSLGNTSEGPERCHAGGELHGQLLWLQRDHVVSDQSFNATVIFRASKHGGQSLRRILTSRRRADPSGVRPSSETFLSLVWSKKSEAITILGVLLGFCGFILQFQGLRGLNWSASIAQLVTIAIMTALRAWVRRHLTAAPMPKEVSAQHELDWLALWYAKRPDSYGTASALWPKNNGEIQKGAAALKDWLTSIYIKELDMLSRSRPLPFKFQPKTSDSGPVCGKAPDPATERLVWTIVTGAPDRTKIRSLNGQSAPLTDENAPRPHPSTMTTTEDPHNTDESNATGGTKIVQEGNHAGGRQTVIQSSRAQKAIQIRRRLAQLTRWPGEAGEAAISLARAITITLNTLLKDAPDDLKTFSWSLDVQLEDSIEQLKLTATKDSTSLSGWTVDATELEAILSLWIFHIHELSAIALENMAEEGENIKGVGKQTDWLQTDFASVQQIVRLLGRDSPSLWRDLAWWMGITEKGPVSSLPRQYWVYYGRLAEFEVNLKKGFQGPIGFPGCELEKTLGADSEKALSLMATGSLQSLLIQHLFTAFMWALVKDCKSINIDNKETKITAGCFDIEDLSSLLSFRLENKVLLDLAKSIQRTGLCADMKEAYLCLIPPLSAAKLLPALPIIDAVRTKTQKAEHTCEWVKVVSVYRHLLQQFEGFGAVNSIFRETVTILIDTLISIAHIMPEQLVRENSTSSSDDRLDDQSDRGVEGALAPSSLRNHIMGELLILSNDEGLGPENIKKIKALRKGGANPNVSTRNKRRALHYAAFNGDDAFAEWLFEELHLWDTGINDEDIWGQRPLHLVARNERANVEGSCKVVKLLLRKGALINARDHEQRTALHLAAMTGRDAVVRVLLLAPNVDKKEKDSFHKTPLDYAGEAGDKDTFETLFRAAKVRPDGKGRDEKGQTAFLYAVRRGHERLILSWLLVGGRLLRDTRRPVSSYLRYLLFADHFRRAHYHAMHYDKPETVSQLCHGDVDVNGLCAVHIAIEEGHKDLLVLLLQVTDTSGVRTWDLDKIVTKDGICIRDFARKYEREDIIELFDQEGAWPPRPLQEENGKEQEEYIVEDSKDG